MNTHRREEGKLHSLQKWAARAGQRGMWAGLGRKRKGRRRWVWLELLGIGAGDETTRGQIETQDPGDLPGGPGVKNAPCSSRASLVAQRAKRLPAMWETRFDPWVRKIPGRRKWQPPPVFLPGESHGGRSLVGYSPQDRKQSDTTERLHFCSARDVGAIPSQETRIPQVSGFLSPRATTKDTTAHN